MLYSWCSAQIAPDIQVVEYILQCIWTHHQWCYLGSLGFLGLSVIRHPRPGKPAGFDQAPACVQVALQTWWPSTCWLLWCLVSRRPCRGTVLQTLDLPPWWVCASLATLCYAIAPPARHILPSSSRWPPRWDDDESSPMFAIGVVVAMFSGNLSCFPKSAFSSQSCAIVSRPVEVVLAAGFGFSTALMKVMGFFCCAEALAVVFWAWSWRQR